MKKYLLIPFLFLFFMGSAVAEDSWLPSLKTDTPEQGFELAIKMARMGVKSTQPDMDVLKEGRKEYAKDADSLINASGVVATHFATVAAANNYWK